MKIHKDITLDRATEAVERVICGAEAEGVEPDARRRECESCGEPGVYGAEELLMRLAV
jgi:hypothetical protein